LTPRELKTLNEQSFNIRDVWKCTFTDGKNVMDCAKSVHAHLDEQKGNTDEESGVFKENALFLEPIFKILGSRLDELKEMGRTMDELFHTVS
jgi:hypothetical protein